jgi:hypothetical protein
MITFNKMKYGVHVTPFGEKNILVETSTGNGHIGVTGRIILK